MGPSWSVDPNGKHTGSLAQWGGEVILPFSTVAPSPANPHRMVRKRPHTVLEPAPPVPSHTATHTNSCTQPKSEKTAFPQQTTLASQTNEAYTITKYVPPTWKPRGLGWMEKAGVQGLPACKQITIRFGTRNQNPAWKSTGAPTTWKPCGRGKYVAN